MTLLIILVFKGRFNNNNNCHMTLLIILVFKGGFNNNKLSVDKLIQSLVSRASERTFVPYHVLLFYWRKRISYTLQYYNAWIINQAYLKLNNCGGGNIHRDFDLENIS